ncbi:hypothetical protein NX722_23515 [Endozoicomonas gorgoniicola]|uniref:Phage shock protein B n=1 Tax=Endozoicomonas gorgoniicola TaxID=1234144 RepID=A0ABT3N1N1_9GAMM|nr:hypothetical protein [Endozoicomonas gorgoniicola]MCW7555536.1 hypothetical protein [Endozoicomonas gorgoniicola]
MTIYQIIIIAMAVFNLVLWGPIGWIVRRLTKDYDEHKRTNSHSLAELRGDLEDLQQRYNDLRAELPDKYVSLSRYVDEIKTIQGMLQKILDKLDSKADK